MFRRNPPTSDQPKVPDPDRELNFASEILQGRRAAEVPDSEVLREAQRLLSGWMAGEMKMERPKLYDHYALVLAALLRRVQELEARVEALEGRLPEASNQSSEKEV